MQESDIFSPKHIAPLGYFLNTPKADALDIPPEQLKKLVQGLVWRDQHFTGATLRDIAKDEGVSESFVGKAIFATFIA